MNTRRSTPWLHLAAALALAITGASCCRAMGATVAVPDATLKSPVEATALVKGAGLKSWFPTDPAISGADTGMNGYSIQSQDPARVRLTGSASMNPLGLQQRQTAWGP